MSDEPTFKVFVAGFSSSIEEWRRAMRAPTSELPPLDAAQKEMARRFRISEEEYARGYLAGLYGQERIRNRGIALGRITEEILNELGLAPECRLIAVKTDMDKSQWVLRIQKAQERILNVGVSYELVDDMLDSGLAGYKKDLRDQIVRAVGELAGR